MDSTPSSPTVTFQLLPADIVALRRHLGSRGSSLLGKLIVPFFIFLVSLTIGTSLLRPRPVGAPGPTFASILALILPVALFLVIIFAVSRGSFGINNKAPILQYPSEVALLPETFSISFGTTTTNTLWRGVERIESTPTHLFVLTQPNDGFIIPRRAFDSDEAFTAFADYAHYKWNEARPQIPPIASV